MISAEIHADERHIALINPAHETALALKALLDEKNLQSPLKENADLSEHRFFVSDDAKKFQSFAQKTLDIDIRNVGVKVL